MISLSRVACLGQWSAEYSGMIECSLKHQNQQKGRVDLILDRIKGETPTNALAVGRHLIRTDIAPLLEQQEVLYWLRLHSAELIYIDSYSELVDQRFRHSSGWSFCACYTDVNHSQSFASEFSNEGLLALDKIEPLYVELFEWAKAKFGNIPIIYVHFPTKFDNRDKFKERGQALIDITTRLTGKYRMTNIIVPDEKISEADDPRHRDTYHFGSTTIAHIGDAIKEALK